MMVVVSDHAVLRYIERVHGIDIDALKQSILKIVEPAARAGAASFSKGNATFCLSRNLDGSRVVVATVLERTTRTDIRVQEKVRKRRGGYGK